MHILLWSANLQKKEFQKLYIIESVDSISRDERDEIHYKRRNNSRQVHYHPFKTPLSCSTADFQSNECITSL